MSLDLSDGVRVQAALPPLVNVRVALPDPRTVRPVLAVLPGPAGPSGSGTASVWNQTTPSASWSIPHTLGRLPIVAIYDNAGNEVLADIVADTTHVAVTWPSATTGSAVLT